MEKMCAYYQASACKSRLWELSSMVRSTEHVAFDRSFDNELGIFEFFVPVDMESIFLELMEYALHSKIIYSYEKKTNRMLVE